MFRRKDSQWQKAILKQLDKAMQESRLPGPPNANFPTAHSELYGFRSSDEWLLAYQIVCLDRKNSAFVVNVHAFGNKVGQPGYQASIEIVTDQNGNSCWLENGDFVLNPYDLMVKIKGELIKLGPSDSDYAEAHIDLSVMKPELAIIRLLAHKMRHRLLLEPQGLLDSLGKSGLEPVFQLSEWQQPDVMENDLPSKLPCFQAIATSLETGMPAGLEVCATTANNHWKNWQQFE